MATNTRRSLITLLLLGALLAGCGRPAAEPAAEMAATPLPPTPTAIPPTPAPTAEPEAEAPSPVAAAPEPVGLRPDAPPYAVHGPYWVGYKPVVIGEGTDHPIDAGLWYPALNPNGDPEEITYPMTWKIPSMPLDTESVAYGHALLEAPVDESAAPYPLVVFSHGFGTSAPWYANLVEHYASHGFIVLTPDHTEQFDFDYSELWQASIDRPNDIKQALDYAEQTAAPGGDLAGLIDMEHVAVAGHSYGGYTALAAAGAQYDLVDFNARCAALALDDPNAFLCAPLVHREEDMAARAGLDAMPEGLWPSFGDPRVTAILPIAGDAYLFDKAGLSKITIPMMAIGGTADTGTPYDWGSKLAYDNTSSAKKVLVTLDGAEHTITTSCENLPWMHDTPFGGWICFDPVWDKDRGMDLINHFSTAFLLDTLKGDAEAAAALAPENVAFHNVRYETNAYGAEPAAAAETEPAGLRPDAPAYAVHGPYAVGTREFSVEIDGRTTPITVWYPAMNPSGVAEAITYNMDVGDTGLPPYAVLGNAIRDAEPDPSGAPYPLAVWSHGAYLYRQTNAYLAEHLASQGFVVVAGNHEDNWGTFPASNVPSNVSRPADISTWIDFAEEQAAAGGALAGLIDTEHIAVGGHSYGGYTALAVSGALFNPTWYLDVACADIPLAEDDPLNDCANMKRELPELAALAGLDAVPEGLWPSWQDPRVDAIFLLAPSSVFGAEGAVAVTIPTMSLTGSADPMQDAALHVYLTHENLSSANKNLVVFENGGHTMFLNDCQSATGMANVAYEWCSDAIWDTDRVHDLTNHFVTAFLLAELKGDTNAAAALAPENVAFPGIRYETTAYTGAAAAVLDGETVARIDAMVEEMMAGEGVPGFALGVVKDGELVYANGFGVTSLEGGQPVTADTAFLWAENTFPLTTVAIMQLVDQGLIDLDAPVTDYLPYFKLADERYVDMTVRHILQHRSGLPESGDYMADWTGFQPESDDGALERYVRAMADKTLLFAPGQRQEWSDISFAVLGDVIAKVSGQSFEAYMQEHVLAPLGMDHSSFLPDDLDATLLAQPHVMDEEELVVAANFPYHRPFGAANNLMASAADMARFAQAMVGRGDASGPSIVSENAFDAMWNESEPTAFGDFAFGVTHPTKVMMEWGAGWFVSEDAGTPTYASFGQEYGFQGQMVVAPEAELAVVAVGNKAVGPAFYASNIAVDVLAMLLEAQGGGN